MTQVSASQHEPSSKMTNSGLAFVATSIVIGTGFAGGAMLVLLAIGISLGFGSALFESHHRGSVM